MNAPEHSESPLLAAQYQALAAKRQTYDTLLWQTPVVALTGQAFLLTTAFNSDLLFMPRFFAGLLCLIISGAAIQLMARHRYFEHRCSKQLEEIEVSIHARLPEFRILHDHPPDACSCWLLAPLINISGYWIWFSCVCLVGVAGLYPTVEWLFRN